MKEIKDYLHLYLGCECKTPEGVMQLMAVYIDSLPIFYDSVEDTRFEDITPLLRPLSDITEEEIKKLRSFNHYSNHTNRLTPEGVRYLLSKFFDLFGLIESGLAIDKSKI